MLVFLAGITSTGNHLTVNGIFRIAVPLFLLINGFYFYPTLCANESETPTSLQINVGWVGETSWKIFN